MLNKNILVSMTRSFIVGGLVFLLLLPACKNENRGDILIEWKGNKASGIIIPGHLLTSIARDKIPEMVIITLEGSNTAILGEYNVLEQETVFHPAIPFTRGKRYEIKGSNKILGRFAIPMPGDAYQAEVSAVYPSADTLPENLLKFYIFFSKPMQQGDMLKYISLVKDGKDTLKDVFLDLQQELWSSDNRILTLWLDPGRIKRNLQPNKLLGPPLQKGHHYTLLISKDWQTAEGVPLGSPFQHEFITGERDDLSPDVSKWDQTLPEANTHDLLFLNFNEAIDIQLMQSAIHIIDEDGKEVEGRIGAAKSEFVLMFQPNKPWSYGTYTIKADTILEDLAGNNLARLFDTDLTKHARTNVVTEKTFKVDYRR